MNNSKDKKVTIPYILVNAFCAAIWIVMCIWGIAEGKGIILSVMQGICGLLWLSSTVVSIIKYNKEKNNREE